MQRMFQKAVSGIYRRHPEAERMATLMKADSLISKIMGGILDQLILNFLFIICCIGVVTIPASVSALYAVELAIHRGEEPGVFSAFLRVLRGNFLQPLRIAGVLLAAVAPACLILMLDVLLQWNLSGFWDWILIAWIIYVYAVGIWAMNLSARYRNTLRKTPQRYRRRAGSCSWVYDNAGSMESVQREPPSSALFHPAHRERRFPQKRNLAPPPFCEQQLHYRRFRYGMVRCTATGRSHPGCRIAGVCQIQLSGIDDPRWWLKQNSLCFPPARTAGYIPASAHPYNG